MCCGDLKEATSGKEMPALAVLHLLRKTSVPGVLPLASLHSTKLNKQDIGQAPSPPPPPFPHKSPA